MTRITSGTEPLYSSLGGDPDLGAIVETFVGEMPNRAAAMRDRLNTSDWEGLCRMAHQLKGAAGSYGFDPISSSAAELDKAIRENEPEEQIRNAVDVLVKICNRARAGVPT